MENRTPVIDSPTNKEKIDTENLKQGAYTILNLTPSISTSNQVHANVPSVNKTEDTKFQPVKHKDAPLRDQILNYILDVEEWVKLVDILDFLNITKEDKDDYHKVKYYVKVLYTEGEILCRESASDARANEYKRRGNKCR